MGTVESSFDYLQEKKAHQRRLAGKIRGDTERCEQRRARYRQSLRRTWPRKRWPSSKIEAMKQISYIKTSCRSSIRRRCPRLLEKFDICLRITAAILWWIGTTWGKWRGPKAFLTTWRGLSREKLSSLMTMTTEARRVASSERFWGCSGTTEMKTRTLLPNIAFTCMTQGR